MGRGEQTVERMHDEHNEQAREENRTGRASMDSWVECGCGQRTDSPATPLPKEITTHPPAAITAQPPNRSLKRLTRLDETKGGQITKVENHKVIKHGFFFP